MERGKREKNNMIKITKREAYYVEKKLEKHQPPQIYHEIINNYIESSGIGLWAEDLQFHNYHKHLEEKTNNNNL